MEIPASVKRCNDFLKSPTKMDGRCGRAPNGKPKYRVAWAPDILELQDGPFNDFTPSGIFIRTFVGRRMMPKYERSGVGKQWVMEQWLGDNLPTAVDDPEDRYELMWAFKEGVVPDVAHVEFILNCQYNPSRARPQPEDILGSPEYREKKRALIRDFMDNENPWIPDQLHSGEAVFLDSTKRL